MNYTSLKLLFKEISMGASSVTGCWGSNLLLFITISFSPFLGSAFLFVGDSPRLHEEPPSPHHAYFPEVLVVRAIFAPLVPTKISSHFVGSDWVMRKFLNQTPSTLV